MKMRFCAKCGYPLPINVKSCIECGAPVEDDPEDQEPMEGSGEPPTQTDDTPRGAHAAAEDDLPSDSREATPIAWPAQPVSDTTASEDNQPDGDSDSPASADDGATDGSAAVPESESAGAPSAEEPVQSVQDGESSDGESLEDSAGESAQGDDEAPHKAPAASADAVDAAEDGASAETPGPESSPDDSHADQNAGTQKAGDEKPAPVADRAPAPSADASVDNEEGSAADEGVSDTTVPETALHPAYTVRRSKFAPPLPKQPKPAPEHAPKSETPAQREGEKGAAKAEAPVVAAATEKQPSEGAGQPDETPTPKQPADEQPTEAMPRTAAAVPISLYGTAHDRASAASLADSKTDGIPAVLPDAASESDSEQKTAAIPAVEAGVAGISDTPAARAERVAQGQTAAMPKIDEAAAGFDMPASAKVRRVSSSNRPQKQTRSQRRAAKAEYVSQAKERTARAEKENAGQQPVRPAVMIAEKRSKKPLIVVIVIAVVLAIILAVLHPWAQEDGNGASSSTEQSQSAATQESASSSSESSSSSSKGSAQKSSHASAAAGDSDTAASSATAANSGTDAAAGAATGSGTAGAAGTAGTATGANAGTAQSAGGNTTANGGTANAGTGTGNGGTAHGGAANGGSGTGGNTTAKKITTGSSTYALTVVSSSGVRLSGTVHRKASGYVIPDSSTKAYTLKQLKKMGLSDAELCIAWNEPYARLGAHFANPALQAYFESCSWYHDRGKTGIQLSGVAAKNVNLLHKLAEQKASSKRWESLATS